MCIFGTVILAYTFDHRGQRCPMYVKQRAGLSRAAPARSTGPVFTPMTPLASSNLGIGTWNTNCCSDSMAPLSLMNSSILNTCCWAGPGGHAEYDQVVAPSWPYFSESTAHGDTVTGKGALAPPSSIHLAILRTGGTSISQHTNFKAHHLRYLI